MTHKTWAGNPCKLEAAEALVDKLKELVDQGNIRCIRIVHQGRTRRGIPDDKWEWLARCSRRWLRRSAPSSHC